MAFVARENFRFQLAVALTFFLFSGQGIRYLIGLPAYGALALILLSLTVASFWKSFSLKKVPLLLGVFLGLASVSLLWTLTPLVTAIAIAVLVATSFAGLSLVWGLKKKLLILSLYRGLQISLFLGLVFELLIAVFFGGPIYPVFHEWLFLIDFENISPGVLQWSSGALFSGGPLQGFVGNRNLFGFIALLTGILAPLLYREKLIRAIDALLSFGLAIFIHIFTGSATITFIAAAVAVLVVAAWVIRGAPEHRRRLLSWLFVTLAAAASFGAYVHRDFLTALLGREPDLTDRTDIWKAVFEVILEYPLGTGWVSYWPIWEKPYDEIITLSGTPIAHAHNAFLDVWLQLGAGGLLVLLGLFAVTLISGWEQVEAEHHGETVRPLAWVLLAVALGLQAVSESRLLLEGNWFLLVIVAASVPQLIHNRGRLKSPGQLPAA